MCVYVWDCIVWAHTAVLGGHSVYSQISDTHTQTHSHTPVLAGDTAAHCVLVKDRSHDSAQQNPALRDPAYVEDMWRLSPSCWNPLCGYVEHSCFQTLLLTLLLKTFLFLPPCHTRWHALRYAQNNSSVCVLFFLGVSGLGPRLRTVQNTSSCVKQSWLDLRRNLREIPGAMDTPGGIWCKESVICTSNTLLNQSQAANPGVP